MEKSSLLISSEVSVLLTPVVPSPVILWGNNLVHIGPCNSRPCVIRHGHNRHVVGRYIYRRAPVCRGRLSGIALLTGPDHCVVLCAELVLPVG